MRTARRLGFLLGICMMLSCLLAPAMAESSVQTGRFSYSGTLNGTSDSTAAYYYSDSYFDHSAEEYDPHLATMSFCLEASVWSSKDTDVWPEKTQNARALLDELAFRDIYQNAAWDQKPDMHSLGLVLAYKNIGSTTLVAAAIRGGGYYGEWGGNLVVGPEGDHEGFKRGSQIALQELEQYVERHCENGDFQPCLKLWIVGFSRGGAVAEMTAAHLTDRGTCGGRQLTADNIYVYTFEAPQGHTGEERTYANIHNIIDPMDVVPLVAPAALGFHRHQQTSTLIVPLLGTKDYELRRDAIILQYEQVLTGIDPAGVTMPAEKLIYAPSPYVMALDPASLAALQDDPGAELRWEPQTYLHTVEETLYGAVNTLFDSLPDGREGYVRDVEQALSHLVMSLREYDAEIDLEGAVYDAMFANDSEGLTEVLAVLLDPELSDEDKEDQATQVALGYVADALLRQIGTDLTQTMSAISDLTHAMVLSMMADPQQMTSFLYQMIENNGIRAHSPEVMLANLMAQDSYYNNAELFGPQPDSYRIAEIAGVGDVTVRTGTGTVLARRMDGDVENTSEIHGLAAVDERSVRVVLPSDEAYTIEFTAEEDEAAVTIYEYSSMWQQYTRQQRYDPAAKCAGMFRLSLPAFAAGDYADQERDGSETIYTLINSDGVEIAPDQLLRGAW